MKILPRFLYLFCFIGMATAAVLALNGALQPSMSAVLLRTVIVAALCGAAGLVHRKAWGVSLLLLPVGCYLLLRSIMPPPAWVEGISGTYRFYVEALATGATQYADKFFPLSLAGAPELRLLLAFTIFWLMGSAAFLGLSLRRPIPGIALALMLLGFSFTVDTRPKTVALAVLFFLLAACMLVFSRSLERRTWRLRDAIPGVAVGAVASLLAIVLLGAAPSAAAAPWRDWRSWDPFNQAGSVYSFNWLQNYPKLLNPANRMLIMKVHSSRPSYWRANALETFTGNAWVSSQDFPQDIQRRDLASGFAYSIPGSNPRTRGQTVNEEFEIRSVYTNYLFIGGDPRSLTLNQDVVLRMSNARALHVSNALGPSLDYTVSAVIPKINPDSLVGLGSGYPDSLQPYLALPFPRADQIPGPDKDTTWRDTIPGSIPDGSQWANLYSLNKKIVGDATDPYDITLRIERYLRSTYEYDLQPPESSYPSPYAAFLFDTGKGYCQHFAGAMALLLRFNGIPSRVAVGFTTGEMESLGVYSVSTTNAHAWVEAYFPKVGWVSFDPTPGRSLPSGGASSSSPGFKDPFASSASPQSTLTTTTPTTDLPTKQSSSGPTSQDSGPSWISRMAWLPWLLGVAALLATWPHARRLWRERGLRRGTLSARLAASLRLLRSDLAAHGVAAARSRTFEEVLDAIEGGVGIGRDPVLAARAQAVLFGGREATEEDVARADEFRHTVDLGLRRRYGWVKTMLRWYGVPQKAPARSPAPAFPDLPDLA